MNFKIDGSDFTFEPSGTFYDSTKKYNWVTQDSSGFDNSKAVFVQLFNPANNNGIKNGKFKIKFPEITSGQVKVSFRIKTTHNAYSSMLGSLMSGDTEVARIRYGTAAYPVGNNINVTNAKKDVASITLKEWHKIEYTADLNTKKFSISVDNVKSDAAYSFESAAASITSVDSICFGANVLANQFNNSNYYIDDLTVVKNPEQNLKTVRFYDGDTLIETKQVPFGSSVTPPTVSEKDGYYFSGFYGDRNGETSVDFQLVLSDMNVYAVYKPYAILEDFGKSTSFRIEDNSIKTDSGFRFSANDEQYKVMSLLNSELIVNGYNVAKSNNLTIGFDEITSGKATFSYKFKMDRHNGNGNPCTFGKLNTASQYLVAAYQQIGFGDNSSCNHQNAKEFPYILTKDTNWHNARYEIDIDNKTFDFYFDDQKCGAYTLTANSVKELSITGMSHAPSNYNYRLANICLVLNPDMQADKTITYKDSNDNVLGTEKVKIGTAAANIPNAAIDGKVFLGWFTDKNANNSANLDCVISDITVYPGYLQETAYTQKRVVPEIGDVSTVTLDEKVRSATIAAKTLNGKKLIYYGSQTDNLVIYDLTDLSNPKKLGSYAYELKSSSLVLHNNFVIGTNNNIIKIIKLDDTGMPTGDIINVSLGNTVKNMQVCDDYLFVTTNGGISVYDVSNISSGIKLATSVDFVSASNYSSFIKVSDKRYRIINIIKKTIARPDGKATATADTVELLIYDFINNNGTFVMDKVYQGIPDLSAVNAWPAFGIYGDDNTVSGYKGFSPAGGGYIAYAGADYVKYTGPYAAGGQLTDEEKAAGLTDTTAVKNNEFVISIKDPKHPKVVSMREKGLSGAKQFALKIDDGVTIEYGASGNDTSAIYDYSDKDLSIKLGDIAIPYANASASDNERGYLSFGKKLYIFNMYDTSETFKTSGIMLNNPDGTVAETVKSGFINSRVYVYNPGEEKQVKLTAALYGYYTGSDIQDTRWETVTLAHGFNEIKRGYDLNELAYYNAYTTYFRLFLWDDFENLTPLAKSAKADAVISQNTEFDIWISDKTETVKGIVLMDRHGGGLQLKEDSTFRNFCEKNDWAIISFEDGAGQMLTNFINQPDTSGNMILNQIDAFAKSTGHSELSNAPIATFGHSSATSFALNFAAWCPERTFAAIGFRVHNKAVLSDNVKKTKNVPIMVNQGELDAYGNNDQQWELSREFNESGCLINYTLDPGASHGSDNWKVLSIMFPFLEKAYAARVPENANIAAAKPQLKDIDRSSGLLGNIDRCKEYIMTAKPNGDSLEWGSKDLMITPKTYTVNLYTNGKAVDSWLFDNEYAAMWKEFSETGTVTGVLDNYR